MGWMGALAIAAGAMAGGQTIMAGNSAAQSASYQARQLRMRAKQADAEAQQKAVQDRRETNYVQSRLQAVAAASGAGAADKGVIDLMSRIQGEGEYRALADLWLGSERSTELNQQANVAQYEGKSAQKQSRIAAFGDAIKTGASVYGMKAGGGSVMSDANTSSLWDKYAADYVDQSMGWTTRG